MINERGSTLVMLLTLLPLILPLCAATVILTSFLSLDQDMKKICRDHFIQAQTNSGRSLEILLQMNPAALALRARKIRTEASLAMATASLNFPMIARFSAELERIHALQAKLDAEQQFLLKSQALSNRRVLLQVQSDLSKEIRSLPQFDFLQTSLFLTDFKHIGLAVQPDQPGVAPAYETLPQFTERQTLSVSWKMSVSFRLAALKKFPLELQRQCAVTLFQRKQKWNPLLKADRFLLKD